MKQLFYGYFFPLLRQVSSTSTLLESRGIYYMTFYGPLQFFQFQLDKIQYDFFSYSFIPQMFIGCLVCTVARCSGHGCPKDKSNHLGFTI